MRTLGVIGGTGLGDWDADGLSCDRATPYGEASPGLAEFAFPNTRLIFVPRHGDFHDIPPHQVNYRANIWALKQLGAEEIIAVNAVGGIAQAHTAGSLAVPAQLVDYTWGRAHSYSDGDGAPLQHVEFAQPFSNRLRTELHSAARQAGESLTDGGCIAVTNGPRLETAAEIRKYERDGCDLVGMTSMPEAALAAELGLGYACLAMVVNAAAGKGPPIEEHEVRRVAAGLAERVRRILAELIGGPS